MSPENAHSAVVDAVLGPRGSAPLHARRVALRHGMAVARGEREAELDGLGPEAAALVDTVARHAYRTTDEAIDAACAAGRSEDEVFDLVVAAALGAGLARREIGLSAVDRWEAGRT